MSTKSNKFIKINLTNGQLNKNNKKQIKGFSLKIINYQIRNENLVNENISLNKIWSNNIQIKPKK